VEWVWVSREEEDGKALAVICRRELMTVVLHDIVGGAVNFARNDDWFRSL
jgi:hypothetical protein